MKLYIKNPTLLLMFSILILGGCLGYGQKTNSEKPIESSKQVNPDDTPIDSDEMENKINLNSREKIAKLSPKDFVNLDYLASLNDIKYVEIAREDSRWLLLPWEPIVVSLDTWKKQLKMQGEIYKDNRSGNISIEEFNKKLLQLYRENNLVTSVQIIIELSVSIDEGINRLANLAYTENPDDFDTLLTWVFAGGSSANPYGVEKTEGTRRLYEMNPNHPWVLHKLAKCLLGAHPEEAIGYAQKAQELDPRYLPFGVEGLCYFQMGDYEKAFEAFKRSQKAAVAASNLRIANAISLWKVKP